MTLGEKIRYLREVEGSLRGMNRPLTQQELMKGIRAETGKTISQSTSRRSSAASVRI